MTIDIVRLPAPIAHLYSSPRQALPHIAILGAALVNYAPLPMRTSLVYPSSLKQSLTAYFPPGTARYLGERIDKAIDELVLARVLQRLPGELGEPCYELDREEGARLLADSLRH